jgi:hypothetical protein
LVNVETIQGRRTTGPNRARFCGCGSKMSPVTTQAREINPDWQAPEVREEIHPKLADEAKAAPFLASRSEALTPTIC